MNRRILLLLLAVLVATPALRAERRVKAGFRGGLLSRTYIFDQQSLSLTNAEGGKLGEYETLSLKSNNGFEAGASCRVRLWKSLNESTGASLHLQLDALYSQHKISLDARNEGDDANVLTSEITASTVDVPLVACLKASVVRLSAGPVLHAYSQYETTGGNARFEGLPSLCGFTLGIGFDFGKVTLDGRYVGEFTKNSWSVIKDNGAAHLTGRRTGWSLCLGLMF